jgi:hypothetical protein
MNTYNELDVALDISRVEYEEINNIIEAKYTEYEKLITLNKEKQGEYEKVLTVINENRVEYIKLFNVKEEMRIEYTELQNALSAKPTTKLNNVLETCRIEYGEMHNLIEAVHAEYTELLPIITANSAENTKCLADIEAMRIELIELNNIKEAKSAKYAELTQICIEAKRAKYVNLRERKQPAEIDEDLQKAIQLSVLEQTIEQPEEIDEDLRNALQLSVLEQTIEQNLYKVSTVAEYINSYAYPNKHLLKLGSIFDQNIWKIWNVVGDGKCMIYAICNSVGYTFSDLSELAHRLLPTMRQLINEDPSSTYTVDCNDDDTNIIFYKNDSDAQILAKFKLLHETCSNLSIAYMHLLQSFFKINILVLTIDHKSSRPYLYTYFETNEKPLEGIVYNTNEIVLVNKEGHYFALFTDSTTYQDNWVKNFRRTNPGSLW